jgi:3-oxoacyl-[acyl-carrier-protein] synthase-3
MFTISEIPNNINQLLKEANVRKEDVGMYIFHQASKIVLDSLKEKLNIENNRFFYNSKYIGNTVSSSIPIALKEASNISVISDGDLILISGFGVGLSWGSCLLNWHELL